MIIKKTEQSITLNGLREIVEDARRYITPRVLVGTKNEIPEKELYEMVDEVEMQVKEQGLNMKFFATTIIPTTPPLKPITINLLYIKFINDENACMNFLIKQAKYGLRTIYIAD